MISVCIPVYNFDVYSLVDALHKQLSEAKITFEIRLYDDGSDPEYKQKNGSLVQPEFVVYKELPQNIGRSRIRNLLADEAQYEYLLFLDCDSIIHKSYFIHSYLEALNTGYRVICGGREYDVQKADKNHLLRWTYGKKAESQPAIIRSKEPSRSFMTNNFLIKKDIFSRVRFNEHLAQYGHEDTLFGYELLKQDIVPLHIENPVLNGDVESNALFLEKTRQGLENLAYIYSLKKEDATFSEQVRLLSFYRNFCCKKLLAFIFPLLHMVFTLELKLGKVDLKLFNLYKLAYFSSKTKI